MIHRKRVSGTIFRLFLLAGLFLGSGWVITAQETAGKESQAAKRLTPDTAVEMAIKNNLNLETARVALDIKKRKYSYVWNQFLPALGVNGTLANSHQDTSTPSQVIPIIPSLTPGAGQKLSYDGISGYFNPDIFAPDPNTLPQWNVIGNFTATLDLSIALFEGVRSTRLDYAAGQVSFEKAKLQVEQGVRKVYNQILLLEANAALLRENYNNAKRQADQAEANYKAGLAPRLTWLQAQVALQNLQPSIDDLDNAIKNLKGNFAILLGLPYDVPIELEPISLDVSYVTSDAAELISKAATGKPDIQELRAGIIALQSQRKAIALQQFTPYLHFGFTWSGMYNPMLDPFKDGASNWFKGVNWNGSNTFSITLGYNFNSLFPFTKEGQQRKDMDAAIQMQNITLGQKIREAELEVYSSINTLEKIRTSTTAQQAAVDLADQSYKLTEEAYKAGLQDFLAVQSSALALEQAKLQLLTQQYSFINTLIDLEYSIGVPFGTLSSNGK